MLRTSFALALALVACGGGKSTPARSTGSGATGSCGDKNCATAEICIETSIGPGTPTVEGGTSTEYRCASEPQRGGGYSCTEVANGHQSCVALIPAAPPHP